ncbi:hypothetical protein PC113_g20932 [Phytophthora cactorum]|uniref:Uncharacterized protein n=1 Tax=Phytophthora cactorum TaxID=29920 RepID=A0A8T0Y727_9STRA|nr:hypothetical protein PC113_g20932 [Phytophthora cactorum]
MKLILLAIVAAAPAACLVINAGVSTEPGGCTLDDVTLWETLPAAPDRAAV